ncbi:cytochrome P450, partial [Streptomyces clavuligerus]|uniref:cytochrome P450 n=1 Tax=Streptomyces clavuligerus TaxID=1901 RepID=UPI0027BA2BD0
RPMPDRPPPDLHQPWRWAMTGGTIARVPGALPLIGHTGAFLKSPLEFLKGLSAHGELVELRFGRKRVLVVCDPDLTQEMLRRDRVYDKGGPIYDRMREAAGNGLATCPSRDHRRQRRTIQPAFHHSRLPGYARTMTEVIDEAVRGWDGPEVDLCHETRSIASSVLLTTLFGTAFAPEARDALARDLETILRGGLRRAVLPEALSALPTPANLRYQRARRRARGMMADLIRAVRAGDGSGDSLFATLVNQHGAGTGDLPMTDEELVDQAITMYVAGTETTAGVVCWALHLAAQHPQAGRRLADECRSVLGHRAATWEDLPHLPYTRQTLLEALRLNPPGWLITRLTTTDDARLGDHAVPRGSTIVYSAYLLSRLPARYEEPEHFAPERWAPGTMGAKVPDGVFGGGARKCIGDEYALIEGVLMLATITARWDVRTAPDAPKRPHLPALTLNPTRLMATVTPAAAPDGSR